MRTLNKLLLVTMLAVTIAIAMTITGCGQTAGENENGENFSVAPESEKDTLPSVEQEITAGQENNAEQTKTAKQEEFAGNAADERSSFLLSSNGIYQGSLDCTMQGRVERGAIKKGDKAVLVKDDGTSYVTRIEKIALIDDMDQQIPAVEVKEGFSVYVWLEGMKPADIQFYDILLGEAEWEYGIPVEFPFEKPEEYSLTLAPQEGIERQGELRLYDDKGDVLQRIPYGTFTEPVYYVLRENGHRNLVIFPEKGNTAGRFLEWDGGAFSELEVDVKNALGRYWNLVVVEEEKETDFTRTIYRPYREGREAGRMRRYHLQRDTGELEIWDDLDDKSLFREKVSLDESGMPVNEEYYELLFTEDLYRWAWNDGERDDSISVEIFIFSGENATTYVERAEYESCEAFLKAYGFEDSVPLYQYYDRLGILQLELYRKEEEDLFCAIAYGYTFDGRGEKRIGFSGYVIKGVSEEEWKDDTYSVMDSFSEEQIDDYRESIEYTSDQRPKHFQVTGLDRNTSEDRETVDMFQVNYVYRDDGTLYYRYYQHDSVQFETYRCVEHSYYDEKERLIYETAYITHGELEDFYIYLDGGDMPAYCLEIDHGGSGTCIERYFER